MGTEFDACALLWQTEASKFAGESLTVYTVNGFNDLKKFTIQQFQVADVVLISSRLFVSQNYHDALEVACGLGKQKATTRTFRA